MVCSDFNDFRQVQTLKLLGGFDHIEVGKLSKVIVVVFTERLDSLGKKPLEFGVRCGVDVMTQRNLLRSSC